MSIMKSARIRAALDVLIHIFNLVTVTLCVLTFFRRTGDGNMQVVGAVCFRYFTVDSNILAALTGLAALPYSLRTLRRGSGTLPAWAAALRGVGTAAVMVTFLTVVLFLGSLYGYRSMFAGMNVYLHGVCPLLALASFTLLEREPELSAGQSLLGVTPVILYGAVYLTQVVVRRAWPDFYGFNIGGLWPVSMAVMLAATALLCLGLRALRKTGKKRQNVSEN